eukprot:TRINITY_DN41004_c0_g1_i2.p3 TRINITY_DN41004_c0_g1~~TRINITY_DN41004_c0_g1_i2.p3  ORF type:complete len:147 (+),score=32.10 TRINITY_DN41004_c0_g1_i2:396-836(+)
MDDGSHELCAGGSGCHYSCETCSGSAENNCQTCNSLNHRTLVPTAHTCPCDMYYFDLGSVDCKECHYSCYKCNADDFNDCTECLASDHRKTLNGNNAVSYTHLTLPTKRIVQISVDAVSTKKKKKNRQCNARTHKKKINQSDKDNA